MVYHGIYMLQMNVRMKFDQSECSQNCILIKSAFSAQSGQPFQSYKNCYKTFSKYVIYY